MKTIAVLIGLLLCGSVASATCRVTTSRAAVIHAASANVVVQFAVPVAVPVASYAPYWYATNHAQFAPYGAPVSHEASRSSPSSPTATATDSGRDATLSQSQPATKPETAPVSILQAKCLKCHSGPAAKHELDLSDPAKLSSDLRLNAIRQVVSEKMPQGSKLTAEETGRLIEELSK